MNSFFFSFFHIAVALVLYLDDDMFVVCVRFRYAASLGFHAFAQNVFICWFSAINTQNPSIPIQFVCRLIDKKKKKKRWQIGMFVVNKFDAITY